MGPERKRPPGLTAIPGRMPRPSLDAWLAANRGRFKPGSVNEIVILHDHACRCPWGEPCACPPGPEIRAAGEDPRRV